MVKICVEQASLVATDESTIEWLENSIALQEKDEFHVVYKGLTSDINEVWEESEIAKKMLRYHE